MSGRTLLSLTAILFVALATGALASPANTVGSNWRQVVQQQLPVYGHRNWIAIVDSAYPAQSRDGIETIVADASQIEVLKEVLADVNTSIHVRPIVYTDAELPYISEADAPGVTAYRQALAQTLGSTPANSLIHEQIIEKLDDAGQTFRILIIKTNMAIPYTSVFLQLDCKYWPDDAEKRLRAAMPAVVEPAAP